jgi:hypothetical protein
MSPTGNHEHGHRAKQTQPKRYWKDCVAPGTCVLTTFSTMSSQTTERNDAAVSCRMSMEITTGNNSCPTRVRFNEAANQEFFGATALNHMEANKHDIWYLASDMKQIQKDAFLFVIPTARTTWPPRMRSTHGFSPTANDEAWNASIASTMPKRARKLRGRRFSQCSLLSTS